MSRPKELESNIVQEVDMKSKLFYLIRSRKFWSALIGIILMVVKELFPNFPLAEDQIVNIVWLLVAYILGVAVEDAGRAIAGQG